MDNKVKEPSFEGLFEIDVVGELTNKKYSGSFKCKILNVKGRAMVSKHMAYLNGDVVHSLDPVTLKLHQQISYLRYSLIEYPDFWKKSDLGYELHDMNVIDAVYEKVIEFEENYLRQVWGDEHVDALKNG